MDKLLILIFNAKASFFIFMIACIFYNPAATGAVELTKDNIDNVLASNELVFINFYAQWESSSKMLRPIFEEAADRVTDIIAKEFPNHGQVAMGTVDCDKEYEIANRFRIIKYPTFRLFRNGQPVKKEYKGKRTVEAFINFMKQQVADPIKEFKELGELEKLEPKKRIIIGYFDQKDQPEYNTYRMVASHLKDDCQFHVGFGEVTKQKHPPNRPIIVFRPNKDSLGNLDEIYPGNLTNFNELYVWMEEKCVPLVREFTLKNAEDLVEEGLPLLILFHAPDDKESIKKYKKILKNDLISEKERLAFLTADGEKLAPILHHFQKSENDLPFIGIDGFKHMYFLPSSDIDVPGKLKQFVKDFFSGKLHKEFHFGPDTDSSTVTTPTATSRS